VFVNKRQSFFGEVEMAEENQEITVGKFLKKIREERGKTQPEIAQKMGVNLRTLCRWESDNHLPPPTKIGKVVCAYEMTEEEINTFQQLVPNAKVARIVGEENKSDFDLEYEIFYKLIMRPKETRQRIIRAAIAYDSVSDQNGETK